MTEHAEGFSEVEMIGPANGTNKVTCWRGVLAASWAFLILFALIICLVQFRPGILHHISGTSSTQHDDGVDGLPSELRVLPSVQPLQLLRVSRNEATQINSRIAFSTAPNPPAQPFQLQGDDASNSRAIDCLASAMYYEAGGDIEGQRAVAQVVLNRVRHPAYPATVCGVVFQGSERSTGCQFTFTCDGAMSRQPASWLWVKSLSLARQAVNGSVFAKVGMATHYHTDWVVPVWSKSLDKVVQINTHIFLRWRGSWGLPSAFHRKGSPVEPTILKLVRLSEAHRFAGKAKVFDNVAAPSDFQAILSVDSDLVKTRQGLAGVNLRGSTLMLSHPNGEAFGFLLPKSHPGSFGLLALDVCRGLDFCKVMGWIDPAAIPKGFPISLMAQKQMAFLYIVDNSQRGEILAWNCDMFPRKNLSECLTNQTTRWDAVHTQKLGETQETDGAAP